MRFVWSRHTLLAWILLAVLVAGSQPTAAQGASRWLAEPMLFTNPKTIGPSGSQLVPDTISDIALIDAANGWATSSSGIWRLEDGAWRRFSPASGTTFYQAISLSGPSDGWIVGSETERVPPYSSDVLMLRYMDGRWQGMSQIARPDGVSQLFAGSLSDVAALPNGTAWAVGAAPADLPNQRRPLLLYFDGAQWNDRTPAEWRYGELTSIALAGPSEAWATGRLGRPGGEGSDAARPALLHLKGDSWAEAPLPQLPVSSQPFTVYGATMRDASEGWAIFYDAGAECGFGYLLHYSGAWSLVPSESLGGRSITALGLVPGTSRGWASLGGCQARGQNILPQRARFDSGGLTADTEGAQLVPSVYALLGDSAQWAAAGSSFMHYSDAPLPTDRVASPAPGERFFPETGHTIGGAFRGYYETHGLELGDRGISARESLALFGYPVSQPFDEINPEIGERYLVQYFERARLEYHPSNPDPYKVLLGRLGFTSLSRQSQGVEPAIPNPDQSPVPPECDGFPETGYHLCAPFRSFWQRSGGLPVFGFPIVDARDERNPTDGQTYSTQWFERERMEYHPELRGTPYEALLGLLGSEDLRLRGYLP
jgi:hypothetical protein